MASSTQPLIKGAYAPSGPNDIRGPCPLINSLANHGYLPRDGRNVRIEEVLAGMNAIGLSKPLGVAFANPIFQERAPSKFHDDPVIERSFFQKLWQTVTDPWSVMGRFGMRKPGQFDSEGHRVLNLDQLGLPNTVEHDISLTRRDHQQGDNIALQKDLVEDLLASSKDGKVITADDLVEFRKKRIARQKADNPDVQYGAFENDLACAEIALILNVIGTGDRIECGYAKAFLQEERLPIDEGWKKRSFGIVGLIAERDKIKKRLGMEFKSQ
ncbi:hypothetical protein FVEN_g6107 [Fusarium venenatum]|uniref:Heme haloperoxidase family profile domain-containing protein n=2 Tax=Fusarium venenatum TaxID=56646 RepID=A0A2L2SUK3_9HYPO|nr:uncharacterized protein FVRRES_05588 [Fusarium venenatum]KAG8356069.1 hypothetical protein FVEN_g6107 [Fusarium venenatum]CEI61152.1 unnamed protein product [Fusarium venenatum]